MYSYKYKNTVVAILLACILTMAIGYAALQQRLNITGTSNISSVYDVRFTNIKSTPSNENVTDKVAPSYTNTTATFSTNLTSPGDTMTYDITVSNLGTLDAKLILVTMSDSNNPAIEFTYEGVKAGDVLKSQESTVVKVTVKYSDTVTTQPDSISSDLTIKLDYSQIGVMTQEEFLAEGNYLMVAEEPGFVYNAEWLGGPLYRENIESITFATSNIVPTEAGDNYWDVSQAQNGSVMAWYVDSDGDNEYEVTIGQDGGVIANPNSSNLFSNFLNLSSVDVSNLITDNVTNMASMFEFSGDITKLDLSNFNTSNVTNMAYMFAGFNSDGEAGSEANSYLKELDISNFNTSNITNMAGMFKDIDVETLDISHFDTRKVTNMRQMFYGMDDIKELDVSNFITSKVTDMSFMFGELPIKELNLRNFDTSNVTDMMYMFNRMYYIEELDLSSFNTSKVTNMTEMFYCLSAIKTIYVSNLWNNNSVSSSASMFMYSRNIVGGNGATYDENKLDVSMANYDTGYFTYKAHS